MNKFFLFLIMLPKGLWRALGADIPQLKAILKVRLMLDDRKPLSFGRQQTKKKPARFMSALSVFLSAVIGMMYIIPLAALDDRIMGLWLYFTTFLLMLSFLLVTDFSTVLFDTRDKSILLPRPINERTLLLSKLLHMFIYLFRIVFPMSLAGWVFVAIENGLVAAIWFPFIVFMLTLVALFLVNGCYLLILNLAKPERFKDIINYFQIGFSVLFFAIVYLMPRAADSTGFKILQHQNYRWAAFTPTYWLAASWTWVEPDKVLSYTKWLSILAIAGPLLLIWLTVRFLSPSFAKKIGGIDVVDAPVQKAIGGASGRKTASKLYLKLANLLNKNPLSKAGFSIAWLQTGRSRNFKMRVYPSFAFVPVYFFYLVTQNKAPLTEIWHTLPETHNNILLLYMSAFIVMNLMSMLVFSDQYKASWLYYSAPIERPGSVMDGAFKAIWVKYYLPIFTVISCFVVAIWGTKSLLDIALALVNITLFAACVMRIAYRRLPFSSVEQMNEKGSRFFKTLFIMIIPSSLGFGHYFVDLVPWLWWLKIVFIGLSAMLLWLVWDSYKNTTWDELKKMDL
jgi:ABC-2 type transport system permease protein